jgi:hypothetical protein
MADVVLYAVAGRPGEADTEIGHDNLAPITHSRQSEAYREQIAERWGRFLERLEAKLSAVARTRPTVTTADVGAVLDAIVVATLVLDAIVVATLEALPRAERRARDNHDQPRSCETRRLPRSTFPSPSNRGTGLLAGQGT